MAQQNDNKDQHTVPKFYLTLFTSSRNSAVLWRYIKGNARPKKASPKSASTQEYFYSRRQPSGEWDHSLERQLGRLETATADALKSLGAGDELRSEERKLVAHFIAVQNRRVKAIGDHTAAINRTVGTVEGAINLVTKYRETIFASLTDGQIEEFKTEVQRCGTGIKPSDALHLDRLFDRAFQTGKTISEMTWVVCRTRNAADFLITSDNPAFVRHPERPYDRGVVGINREIGAELGFPLSRNSFLLAHWNDSVPWRVEEVNTNRVRELNTRTVLSASPEIFSPERSDAISAQVMEHAGFRLQYPAIV
jgi:hypothetical protein